MEMRDVQVPPQREGNDMCTPTRAASSVYSKTPLFAYARASLHPRPATHLVTLLSAELLAQLSRLSFVVALLFTKFFSHTQASSCLLPLWIASSACFTDSMQFVQLEHHKNIERRVSFNTFNDIVTFVLRTPSEPAAKTRSSVSLAVCPR